MKTGTFDEDLKNAIDEKQRLIDHYMDCIIDLIPNPYAADSILICRLRIKELTAEKWELVKRI